ncbi:translation initiation factor 2 subunit beta [Indivirus ILV1]|uniref:Translation initiation factor 2 subunit beta n=1 Tax=Indivirus ILV1 TaxID=1977633 RepID=A0A1V0SDJ5_9VIRU|nr:translation initiation factor 2 subunit beta [Indivirus ILV1]
MNLQTYSVEFLADRLYDELLNQNVNNKKLIIEKPIVKSLNKKTFILNFTSICSKINRPTLDVKQYFEREMSTSISINAQGSLVITGTFKEINILKVFSSYIENFVKCTECGSCETEIIKENRITYNNCKKCKSKKAL